MGKGINLESVSMVGYLEEIDNVKLVIKPKFVHIKRKNREKSHKKVKKKEKERKQGKKAHQTTSHRGYHLANSLPRESPRSGAGGEMAPSYRRHDGAWKSSYENPAVRDCTTRGSRTGDLQRSVGRDQVLAGWESAPLHTDSCAIQAAFLWFNCQCGIDGG